MNEVTGMRTVESGKQKCTRHEQAFDLRGLLAQCVKGNSHWLIRINNIVAAHVTTKAMRGEFAYPLPLSDR
jgi:hypothetical protein